MKSKIWVIIASLALIFFIIYIAAFIFVSFDGRRLLTEKLKQISHKEVSIGYLRLTPFFDVHIGNLNIKDTLDVEKADISISLPFLMTGQIAFNNISIIKPVFTFVRQKPETAKPGIQNVPQSSQPPQDNSQAPVQAAISGQPRPDRQQMRLPHLIIKRFRVKDAKVIMDDRTAGQSGIVVTLKDLNINLTDLYLMPVPMITSFELSGRIPWQKGEEEGKIDFTGWLNLYKKDIEAEVKIRDIDGVYLYPYYSQWVDLEKARIEKAKLNFTSNIQGHNNNVTAECHLELTDIVRKPRPPEEGAEKAEKIANTVFDIFKAMNQGKIVLDFTIRTKMDRPEFGFNTIRSAFEGTINEGRSAKGIRPEGIFILPIKLVEGAINSVTDVSKAVIDGSFAVGNELKKAVKDSFKKENK